MEKRQKLGILQNRKFKRYLENLPTQRLAQLMVVGEDEVKVLEVEQTGCQPPITKKSKKEG